MYIGVWKDFKDQQDLSSFLMKHHLEKYYLSESKAESQTQEFFMLRIQIYYAFILKQNYMVGIF